MGVLAGCSGDGGGGTPTGTPGSEGSGGPITIGALEPISGNFAPWATVHRDGLQFAVDEVNSNGGVLDGRNLQVEVTDTGADPAQADSSFRRLVEQENAIASTGSVSSDVGLRVAQTASDLDVPHVLHMAGTDEIITQDTELIFRLGILPALSYLQAQATAFADAGYSSIGAIVADYAWGHSAQRAIEDNFEQDVQVEVAPVGESDFGSYIRQMPDDLEMMIASGHPPGSVSIANQLYELGFEPEVVTGATTPSQLLAGALSERARQGYVHIHNADPYERAYAETASAFGEDYDSQFNTHTAHGYVTGKLIAEAIEVAGEATGSAVSARRTCWRRPSSSSAGCSRRHRRTIPMAHTATRSSTDPTRCRRAFQVSDRPMGDLPQ